MVRNSSAVAAIWLTAPKVTQRKNARSEAGISQPPKAFTPPSQAAAKGRP